jgi:hypothetical protein
VLSSRIVYGEHLGSGLELNYWGFNKLILSSLVNKDSISTYCGSILACLAGINGEKYNLKSYSRDKQVRQASIKFKHTKVGFNISN